MKKYFSNISLAIVTVFAFASCSTTSHVEVAQGVNFNNYKTFGWANDTARSNSTGANNEIVDNNIKNSISAELEKKGWKETGAQPDVLLDYNVMVEKGVRKETEPAYNYPYTGYYFNSWRHRMGYFYNPGFFQQYYTYNVPFKEGTLSVNMVDAKTNKLIWQGWAKGDVSSKNVTTSEVNQDVKSIFKKFDLPKTNS
jgi:hypothetical protein